MDSCQRRDTGLKDLLTLTIVPLTCFQLFVDSITKAEIWLLNLTKEKISLYRFFTTSNNTVVIKILSCVTKSLTSYTNVYHELSVKDNYFNISHIKYIMLLFALGLDSIEIDFKNCSIWWWWWHKTQKSVDSRWYPVISGAEVILQ